MNTGGQTPKTIMTRTAISHYSILNKLGQGGMGEVFRAEDSRLGRVVALKFLTKIRDTEEYRKRFEKEARASAALNHPNICTIYAVEEHEGERFIAMEYIEGQTLREVISSGEIDTGQAISYGIQIASALTAAHEKGIIHRDLKPENIMVDRDGQIKVMDFGLAFIKGTEHITRPEVCIGTAAYMSPEQLRGEEVDLQSDLFSFGIILYEMLAGRHPFEGEYEQAITYRLLNEDPPKDFLSDKNLPGLEKLLMRCLEKKPADRCRSAQEIKNELKRFQNRPDKLISDSALKNSRLSILFSRFDRRYPLVAGGFIFLALLSGMWLYSSGVMGSSGWESIPEEKHLIVLPFNNLDGDAIPASFSDGILEILTSKITQMGSTMGSLWVVPNSEVRSEQVASVTEASKLFGANMAVTGSLQRTGNNFQLTINLVDASTLRQLRSSVLELEWTDFSHLQDEVVSALVQMLEIELSPETERTLQAGHSQDSEAYQLFIEGRGFLSRHEDPESVKMAIEKFEQALKADPEYARALAGLGEAYWRKFSLTNDAQWADPALEHARKAIQINDELADVQVTLAMIYNGLGRFEDALNLLENLEQHESGYEAQIEFAKAFSGMGQSKRAEEAYLEAIDIKKTFWDAYNQLGYFYYGQGRYNEAVDMFKKVTEWTPDSYSAYYRLGAGYFSLEQNREAEQALKKSLELRPNYRAYSNLGTIYFYEGRYLEAIQMFEQALQFNDADYRIWGNLGFAYYWTGENPEKVRSTFDRAIEIAENMADITPGNDFLMAQLANYYAVIDNREQVRYLLGQLISREVRDPIIMVTIADTYEILGERDAAFSWIENALEQGYAWENLEDRLGLQNLLHDPRAQPLREKYE